MLGQKELLARTTSCWIPVRRREPRVPGPAHRVLVLTRVLPQAARVWRADRANDLREAERRGEPGQPGGPPELEAEMTTPTGWRG
jgi:hypothetical protein